MCKGRWALSQHINIRLEMMNINILLLTYPPCILSDKQLTGEYDSLSDRFDLFFKTNCTK